ncbi:MAG: 50S ribosomal protein L11, partial [Nitrospina sp.]|nr:50S ribosomal protein L11 [Nitrospina sp.]
SFITKSPPASALLKQAAGIAKGSSNPSKDFVGTVTQEQVREIAKVKMEDLNAEDVEAAMRIVSGSAKSMGLKVEN